MWDYFGQCVQQLYKRSQDVLIDINFQRKHDEREEKLQRLTQSIRGSMVEKAAPGKIDTVVAAV